MMRKAFTSILAIAWASTAHAETADPVGPATAPPHVSAAGDTLDGAGGPTVDEIIVTAQRREERLVDVPISITPVSAEAIERAGGASLENLTKTVPGVYFQRAIYGLSPTIRGVGSALGGNVAVYVDDVARPVETSNIFDLASVAGVDILKGPQGTLFGVNATGGALLIRTLDPGFDLAGKVNISYERFDQVRASAYVNVPINDMIAVNGSVAYRYSRGYIRDLRTGAIVNEGRNFTARGKLLFQPADNLSVILTAAHAEFDDPTGASFQAIAVAPIFSLVPDFDSGPIARDRFHLSHNAAETIRTSTDEFSARVKLELDFVDITAITAYQKNDIYSFGDLDATYTTLIPLLNGTVEQAVDSKTFSQELNVTSKGDGPFSYVAGLYYFYNGSAIPILRANGVPNFNAFGSSRSYAAYAEGTYKFGDLSLFAGLRYSSTDLIGKTAIGVDAPSPFTRIQEKNEDYFTPRAGVRYALGPSSNVYATYSKGVKSGRFDVSSPNGPAVLPEKLDAFEVGFKTASREFSFNAAAYYYDYRNFQVATIISGGDGAIVTQYFNVPKSEVYGLEADMLIRFGDAFDLRIAGAYNHARYTDFPSAPSYTLDPAVPGTLGGLIFAGIPVDAKGNNMIRAPEFSASATLGYHTDLGNGARLDLAVSPYYSSRVYFDFANDLSQKPYITLDASATLTFDERFKVSVFGRNLTDEIYFTNRGTNTYATTGNYAMPRTWGISLGYNF